jgi:hypothetical protein
LFLPIIAYTLSSTKAWANPSTTPKKKKKEKEKKKKKQDICLLQPKVDDGNCLLLSLVFSIKLTFLK